MKSTVLIFLVLVVSGCASSKVGQIVEICEQYSNAYVAAALSKENGLTLGEAKACAIASTSSLSQERICKGSLTSSHVSDVNKLIVNAYKNRDKYKDAMRIMMVTAAINVYNSPVTNPYIWKEEKMRECKARNNA